MILVTIVAAKSLKVESFEEHIGRVYNQKIRISKIAVKDTKNQ